MISEYAVRTHTFLSLTIVLFFISFFAFIGTIIWINLVSQKYLKYSEDLIRDDETK